MHRIVFSCILATALFISQPAFISRVHATETTNETDSQLSLQTLTALASNDYVTVGLALFSASSQADIDALDARFQRLLKREIVRQQGRVAVFPVTLSQRITTTITGGNAYTRVLAATALHTLKRGDILLRRSQRHGCMTTQRIPGCRHWAAVYDHAAIYYGTIKGVAMLYESVPHDGVRLVPLSSWLHSSTYIGIYRAKKTLPPHQTALARMLHRYGSNGSTHFNSIQTNKAADATLSSAQLVWQYYRSLGVNIDSNNTLYAHWLATGYSPLVASYIATHAIAPDEIALSTTLTCIDQGWTR